MKLFISHIHEEAAIALILKDWIESSFIGQCEVFVSSDDSDIPAGSKWLSQVDNAIDESSILVVLCSVHSLSRPWINFETGCGWIKRVPIVPICHSGLKKSELPPPISTFQALELEDPKFIDNLLLSLAKHFGFSKIPRIDKKAMEEDLMQGSSCIKLDPDETKSMSVSKVKVKQHQPGEIKFSSTSSFFGDGSSSTSGYYEFFLILYLSNEGSKPGTISSITIHLQMNGEIVLEGALKVAPEKALIKPGDYRIERYAIPLAIKACADQFPTDFSWKSDEARPQHKVVFSGGSIEIELIQNMSDKELIEIPINEFTTTIQP